MRVIQALTLILVFIFSSSCGSSDRNSVGVTHSVTYESKTPGNGAQDITYIEVITLSGDTMAVVRSGGEKVRSGTWHITLKSSEVIKINGMLLQATHPEVTDKVSTNSIYDDYSLSLDIANKSFRSGMVDGQLHEFPTEASSLVTYLDELLNMYCGSRYYD